MYESKIILQEFENLTSCDDDNDYYDFEFFFQDSKKKLCYKLLSNSLIVNLLNKEMYGIDFNVNELKHRYLLKIILANNEAILNSNEDSSWPCNDFIPYQDNQYAFILSAEIKGEVVACFDINIIANFFHKHNFGIDSLVIKDIEKYKANFWLMSPSCQPYTRRGKSLDDKDQRSKGFLQLIDILSKLSDHLS
ncbi:hypothetical protein C1645_815755 [Glomus cerebriforme]|uniref:DNA (cytosine-5-)-methyltransferase n=1 Tax=Glomus cerebriforme TaxID=658196 RepID=A0A397TE07_9GLOM|nr:hypothetical protein C1645_815755 [Glomus cerebriforme]